MAVALIKCQVTIATVDYSAQVTEGNLAINGDKVEVTNFLSVGWEESVIGILRATLDINFGAMAADLSGLDSAVYTALSTRALLAFTFRDFNTAIATTNPELQGFINPVGWNYGGSVGAALGQSVSWPVSGAIVRDVTP